MSCERCPYNNMNDAPLAVLQQGDSFPIDMQYKDGDTAIEVEEGYDVMVAFYDYKGELILKGSLSDGRIKLLDGNKYSMFVDHYESMGMVGSVKVEVSLFSKTKETVDHADHVFVLQFEPRNNNKEIG